MRWYLRICTRTSELSAPVGAATPHVLRAVPVQYPCERGVAMVECSRLGRGAAVGEDHERRALPRTMLSRDLLVRLHDGRVARLLDLSEAGAQIEHVAVLRPAASCRLELPPSLGALLLPAQVVWCTVVGRKRKLGGDSQLVARSGLRFTSLTAQQQAALADILHALTTALQPIA